MLLSYVTSFIHTKHNLSLKKSIILNRDIKSMITIHDRSSFIKSSKSPLISTISPTTRPTTRTITRPTTRTITKLSMSDDDNDDNDNVDTFNNENNENIDSTAFGDHVPKVRRLERRAGAKRQRHQSEIFNSSLRSSPSHIWSTHITNNLPLVASLLTTRHRSWCTFPKSVPFGCPLLWTSRRSTRMFPL